MSKSTAIRFGTLLMLTGWIAASHSADTKSPKLEMKVYSIDLEQPKLGNRKEVSVHAEIRNIGSVVVFIPTKGIGPIADGNQAFQVVCFQDIVSKTRDGLRIAHPLSELAIVELRPREAVIVAHTFRKPAPGTVHISYKISKEFAERYGTWQGELDGGSIQLN